MRRARLALLVPVMVFATWVTACAESAPKRALPPVTPIMIPPPMPVATSQDLRGVAWHWQGPAGGPPAPRDLYTLEFAADGRALVRADCNRGSGRYTVEANGRLSLTPIATTKMGCPAGSLDTAYLRALALVEGYRIEGEGLSLALRGGGAMRFVR
jgi:heat shock protein HslJ